VTSKGQVTIPLDVRDQPGLSAGDRIAFIFNEGTRHSEIVRASRSVIALKGIVRKPAKPVSIEDINSAIGDQGTSVR
jgi:antitoxin PrlF